MDTDNFGDAVVVVGSGGATVDDEMKDRCVVWHQ
jgi:hypothetical protein